MTVHEGDVDVHDPRGGDHRPARGLRHPDARLVLVGRPHDEQAEALKKKPEVLGVAERVRFIGRAPREELPAMLSAAERARRGAAARTRFLAHHTSEAAALPLAELYRALVLAHAAR